MRFWMMYCLGIERQHIVSGVIAIVKMNAVQTFLKVE